jgi:uncharacterized coiled-coil DUF342 family protein
VWNHAEAIYTLDRTRTTLLAGYMISEEKYFEEISKVVRMSAQRPDAEEYLQELFRSMSSTFDRVAMKLLDTGEDADDVREKRDEMARSFLHLKDTYIRQSGQEIGVMQGTYFRCKLRAVDGFWLGLSEAH